jgi:hypothetical protein
MLSREGNTDWRPCPGTQLLLNLCMGPLLGGGWFSQSPTTSQSSGVCDRFAGNFFFPQIGSLRGWRGG